jgi:hypothetical protein
MIRQLRSPLRNRLKPTDDTGDDLTKVFLRIQASSLLTRSCKFLWASCTFGLSQTAKDGYKFGYRHQFGLITENYAKLLGAGHCENPTLRSITLIYHRHTVFSGDSQSVGGNSMAVRFPLPAPSILFIFSGFARSGAHFLGHLGYKIGYSAHLMYFQ